MIAGHSDPAFSLKAALLVVSRANRSATANPYLTVRDMISVRRKGVDRAHN